MNFAFLCFLLLIIDTIQLYRSYIINTTITCQRSISIKNGRVKYRHRSRFAKFLCNTNYTLATESLSECVRGKWTQTQPKCVRIGCKQWVNPPTNLIQQSWMNGAVWRFFCKTDYILKGPNVIYCDGSRWDSAPPTCLPKNQNQTVAVQLSCDFESATDLCGWNHDLHHDFDWKRENLKTPSGKMLTGPSYDHTKGPLGDGYYMYIESSGRRPYDVARLISPVYKRPALNPICFEFWYHMYGLSIGTLHVYLRALDARPHIQNTEKMIFERQGNQGNKWLRGLITLGRIEPEYYQIVVEGVRGTSFTSDIAVDDVRIIENCQSNDIETTTNIDDVVGTTEEPPIYESCQNRCGNKTGIVMQLMPPSAIIITCDCDYDCADRSRCCPDFTDNCVTSDSTTLILDDNNLDEEATESAPTKITRVATTTTTILPVVPTKIFLPTKRPIIVLPAATTVEIIRKFIKDDSKINFKKPATNNNIVTVPRTTITITPPPPQLIKSTSAEIKNSLTTTTLMVMEIEPDLVIDERLTNSSNNINTSRILIDSNVSDSRRVVFIVLAVLVVVGGVVIVVSLILKRYYFIDCQRLKRRLNAQSAYGTSQSDVRFLSNDEILDFSLSGEYDSN